MMQAAQGYQIGEFGRSTIGPMLDVVCIDITLMRAAWETAPMNSIERRNTSSRVGVPLKAFERRFGSEGERA
jgi:hypothetical protein